MKDLFKIYRSYIIRACVICITMLFFNLALFFGFLFYNYDFNIMYLRSVSEISDSLVKTGGSYLLPPEMEQALSEHFAFAMLIDDGGQVVWSHRLPEDIPRSYSLSDIASFTRWYLMDYPVRTWEHADGLFVAASPKGSLWKYSMTYSVESIKRFPIYLFIALYANLVIILLLALLLGHRFYASLRPLARGIERLSAQEETNLAERGLTGGLAARLNSTSALLQQQKQALSQRDNARTNWIAGVSHDIRTPLSLIMGYADDLERSERLTGEEKKAAASIRENSLRIKKLIEDLNLTSRLSYNVCPLRLTEYSPAALLRELIASCMNRGLTEEYEILPELPPELDALRLAGDVPLLTRAFDNLLGNSIRHNPAGCAIHISASLKADAVCIRFSDNGPGIPQAVIDALHAPEGEAAAQINHPQPHVMGLRVVKQIIEAHQGRLAFEMQDSVCRTVTVTLPYQNP